MDRDRRARIVADMDQALAMSTGAEMGSLQEALAIAVQDFTNGLMDQGASAEQALQMAAGFIDSIVIRSAVEAGKRQSDV